MRLQPLQCKQPKQPFHLGGGVSQPGHPLLIILKTKTKGTKQ